MLLTPTSQSALSKGLLDVLIRAGLIVSLVIICYRIFFPFLNLMLWSIILAVTLYPLHRLLKRKLGGKNGLIATLIVLMVIAVISVPVYLLGASLAASAEQGIAAVRSGTVHVPPPSDAVAGWPIVGERLHALWSQAATDLTKVSQEYAPQLKAASLTALGKLAAAGVGLLLFVVALALAGIFMAYGESGQRSAVLSAERIFGNGKGKHVAELCTATIRAVAQGVIGIAFIQMLLIGVAFVLMDIPAAGLLALGVLLLGIMQVPATLITVPVIVFVFASDGASVATIVFAIYTFVAGLADNVLKPLLLGRGVDVPMPVVLIGALGGMVTGGIIGLFIGPVVLGIGYELYWQWVMDRPPGDVEIDAGPVPLPVTPRVA